MDYDDDDGYDQYRQYEDDLYKDESDESNASDEVDSEVEDTMLGHIHYSTNVYKKIGAEAKSTEDQDTGSLTDNKNGQGSNGLLAKANAPAEDYFKSTTQGTEADSDNDQEDGALSLPNGTPTINISDDDGEDEEEESKYKVERKRDTQNGPNGKQANSTGSGSDSDMDLSDSDSESVPHESIVILDDDEQDENDVVSDDDYAQSEDGDESLDEHVLDLTKTISAGQEDDNDYDPDAELGHLDDKKFQGRGRYYLEEAPARLCHKCQLPGHLSRDCNTMRCHICGALDSHLAKFCPVSTCYKCNKTGHIAADCRERGYGKRCEKCGSSTHASEDCPTIWRVYVLSGDGGAPSDVVQYCYNCASLGHFGDVSCSGPTATHLFHSNLDASLCRKRLKSLSNTIPSVNLSGLSKTASSLRAKRIGIQ
ncbi:MAG: hypothetical protein J3R72DRAFT_41591 [Linnemannia gamsii]|nr:MAG: hypothetical protein J3R72DRAFT_41591 [Linnemannia gamsii]